MFFRLVAKHPVDPAIAASYAAPALRDAGVRADLTKAMRNASSRYTIAAARKFGDFVEPVLIAWTPEDSYWFPWKYAERLRAAFPNSRLERIEDSLVFSPEDQPEKLAELITAFMRETEAATV
jgi:pimeloyl-ACP methyl ester carboxylesterase